MLPEAQPAALRGQLRHVIGTPRRVDLGAGPPPAAVMAALNGQDRPAVLWGSWFGGGAVVMHSPLRTLAPVDAADGFSAIDDQPALRHPGDGLGGGWLTSFGYDPGTSWLGFYDHLLRCAADGTWTFETLGLDGREPAMAAALDGWRALLAAAAEPTGQPAAAFSVGRFDPVAAVGSTEERYLAAVEGAIGRIRRGDFYQVNICTRLAAAFTGNPLALFAAMGTELTPAYGAFVPGPRPLASFSPELFLRITDGTITTAPIKGTAPRWPDDDDQASAQALRNSTKDAAENIMIVDLMRNDLSRVCRPGSVVVEDLLGIEPHPGVWHLVSRVSGRLAADVTTGSVLAAAFPPGSVTGAPKSAARRGIAELETQPRGAYTGAIGFVTPTTAEFNVIIRTLELDQGELQLGVGGGITVDSVPVREWHECGHKAEPLVRAAGGQLDQALTSDIPGPADAVIRAGVFETLLAVRGRLLRLADHLARLDRSCRELYGHGVPAELAGRMQRAAGPDDGAGRQAVRVSARPSAGGLEFTVLVRPLAAPLRQSALRQAERPLRSWRHKWCERRLLEAAETAAGAAMPYFTAPAGHVTETSRGNLFALVGGVWLTPAADEHLLPGVTRRVLLDHLDALGIPYAVRRFSTVALRGAAAAFWSSSLNGAVRVTAVDGSVLPTSAEAVAIVAELNRRLTLE